jgi:hypothetical protein
MPDNRSNLLPCPFCGGAAEMDSRQGYRALSDGRIGSAVAIYCVACSAQHTACHRDHPDMQVDDICEMVRSWWNKRASPTQQTGMNWELSEETKKQLAEIDLHTGRGLR